MSITEPLIHQALQRDLRRLPGAVERITTTSDAVRLQRWYARFERELHRHVGPDALAGPRTTLRVTLDALSEHSYVWLRADAVAAADALASDLADHLDQEEGARVDDASLAQLAFELPWAFDGVHPDIAAERLAVVPAPIRLLHRFVFTPAYRRVAVPVRGVA